jgi:U3 small nucleolar RNA-associated protein 6
MAEHVQAALDQMVAPLRDLMDRHIFTDDEIRSIVSRRRESEYLLRRRAARKADFVRYIEAEMLLEKLRALRTAKRKKDHRKAQREKGIVEDRTDNGNGDDEFDEDGNPNPKKQKKEREDEEDPIGDVHIVQHIHLLFVRAIRKFRGDLSLHLQHAEFCKSAKSWTRLSRVYAECLQIFPREAGIWIEAASTEFFGPSRSVSSARVLLQRALRLNGKTSQELWIQYFTLELHYAQTLKGRRKILSGDGDNNSDDDDSNSKEANKDVDEDKTDNDESDSDTDYNKIPMVILRNAIRSIPNNVQFRLKFLDACQEFPDTTDLMDCVQESMASDFADEPESWIARAIYQAETKKTKGTDEPNAKRVKTNNAGDDESRDPVIAVLEDAIDALTTSEMILQAFRFAEDYRREAEQQQNDDENEGDSDTTIAQIDGFIESIWVKTRGGSINGDQSELAMEQTRYLLRQGKEEDALKTIKNHCTDTKSSRVGECSPSSAEAWLLWVSLAAPSSLKKQKSILKWALQSIPVDQHPDYVVILLQYFAAQLKAAKAQKKKDEDESSHDHEKNLFETLQNLLLLTPKTVGDIAIEPGSTGLDFELCDVFEGYEDCLDHFYKRKGIAGARSIYEAVLFRSTAASVVSELSANPIRGFVDRCLALEQQEQQKEVSNQNKSTRASTSTKAKRRVLCKLYDKAIYIFEGTPLEESYRHDRNELAVFA